MHLRSVRAVLEQQTADLKRQMCYIFYRRRVRSAEVCHALPTRNNMFFCAAHACALSRNPGLRSPERWQPKSSRSSFKKSPWLFEKADFRLQRSLREGGEKRNDVSCNEGSSLCSAWRVVAGNGWSLRLRSHPTMRHLPYHPSAPAHSGESKMKGTNGSQWFLICHCIVWSPVVPATFVATASSTPAQVYADSRDLDGRMSDFPSATGIHLANSISGLNDSENLGNAAERLLSGMRETHYQHSTHVDRAGGVYDMDCSGFVDYLLKRIAPAQFAQLRIEPGHARPRAAMYFELFKRLHKSPLPGWEAVQKLGDARRGDIIAWQLVSSTQEPGDTGHVVIVAAAPIEQTDGLFRVEVYDSSGIRHDDDSRAEGTNGVGKGVITFRVDAFGEPVGFQFNSRAHFHGEPIAIGRLVNR